MALNGLDSQPVNEAFQTAISEPGGWFLLKYISRDEVDILARGNGGVADLREAVAGYSELSPLYGFLRFRRRSVLVRCVPKDTSRLIQARVKVHFQPVVEKFSPHDAIFAISEAAELKETSLSAACSLHAASGSTASTTSSVRRPHLGEIAEDVEEAGMLTTDSHKPLPPLPYEQAKMSEPPISGISRPDVSLGPATGELEAPVQARPSSSKTQAQEGVVPLLLTQTLSTTSGHNAIPSLKPSKDLGAPFSFNRQASRDTYNASVFAARPKIKLGPRPSLQAGRRPHTSSSAHGHNERRPVSTLPAGIRMAPRRSQTANLSSSHQPQPQKSRFPISIPIKPAQVSDQPASSAPSSPRPLTSPGPRSPGSTASSSSTLKAVVRTPEKERLMRALELRRKQMNVHSPESAIKEEGVDSPVNTSDGLQQIPQREQEYPRDCPRTDDVSNLVDGDDANQTALPPSVDFGVTASTPTSLDDLTLSLAGEDSLLPSMEVGSHESSSNSSPSQDERTVTGEVTGEKGAYADGDKDMTDMARKVEDVARSPNDDATEGLSTTTEDEGNGGLPDSNMECSPVSSKNSTELPSTQASSFSEETYYQTPFSTEKGQEANIEHKSTLIKLTAEAHRNILSSTGTTSPGAEPSNDSQAEHIFSREGASPVTDLSDPPVTFPVEVTPNHGEMSIQTNHTEANTAQMADNLQSSTDILSERDVDGKASSIIQASPELVSRESSVSLKTASCGAESPGSASFDVIRIHSKEQRRPLVDPIRTDVSADNSDDNLLSDDSLMDELHSAIVQEAKPVSVGRSPITSTFPRSRDDLKLSRAFLGHRAASSPASETEATVRTRASASPISAASITRSDSGSFVGGDREKKGSVSMIKKVNVSSGISQRIKALERVSSQSTRPNVPPLSAPATKAASPSFPALRKISLRSTSKIKADPTDRDEVSSLDNATFRNISKSRQDIKSAQSKNVSPQDGQLVQLSHEAGNSTKEQLDQDIGTSYTHSEQLILPETEPSNLLPRNLSQSTGASGRHNVPTQIALPITNSVEAEEPSLPSSPQCPSQTSNLTSPLHSRRPSLASARSNSSHGRSQAKSPRLSGDSSVGGMVNGESGKESNRNSKRASRTSRLFRRVSSISNTSRRSLINALSLAVKEEEPVAVSNSVEETKRISIEIGDINVQFPDNLLWKRRCMRLDSQGYLVLTRSSIDEKSRISAKRYHISDFSRPFAPDLDMQEMPNSVVMDFRDGSSLQCACESSAGQAHVLSVLRDSYNDWVEHE